MKYLFVLLSLFFIETLPAQYTREDARQDLMQLRNGMLLVRLHTHDAAISHLEAQERTKEAEQLKQRQYEENKEILLSFSKTFNFCPVYFFYSGDSEAIREGNLQGNIFDAQLQPVDPANLPEKYYTAEFSETENLGITGLIVMNDDLFPLAAPFPFYQRKYILLGLIALSKAKMVDSYNQKLHNTYKLWFPEGEETDATPQ